MPNFDAMETYSIFHPVGMSLLVCIAAGSAWLSAVADTWRGWAMYAVLLMLMMSPSVSLLGYFVITGAKGDLGLGILLIVTVPLALAWLLGLPFGLLLRLGRSTVPKP